VTDKAVNPSEKNAAARIRKGSVSTIRVLSKVKIVPRRRPSFRH
jgi:hypothetical protein